MGLRRCPMRIFGLTFSSLFTEYTDVFSLAAFLSFPNTHITWGEQRCGYPMSPHPVSILRHKGYDCLRRRLRRAALNSAWDIVDHVASGNSVSSCP